MDLPIYRNLSTIFIDLFYGLSRLNFLITTLLAFRKLQISSSIKVWLRTLFIRTSRTQRQYNPFLGSHQISFALLWGFIRNGRVILPVYRIDILSKALWVVSFIFAVVWDLPVGYSCYCGVGLAVSWAGRDLIVAGISYNLSFAH